VVLELAALHVLNAFFKNIEDIQNCQIESQSFLDRLPTSTRSARNSHSKPRFNATPNSKRSDFNQHQAAEAGPSGRTKNRGVSLLFTCNWIVRFIQRASRLSNTRFAFPWGRYQIRAAKPFATSLTVP
jgi:hypothetical protein